MRGSSAIWIIILFTTCWDEIYCQCGETRGCSYFPANCDPSTPDCISFVWTYDTAAGKFAMTITGGPGITSYAGVAFTQQAGMQDGDLYYCTGEKLQSAAITGQVPPADASNAAAGLENITFGVQNGVASCSFTRPTSVKKTVSTGEVTFDLATTKYYIIFARGSFSGGALVYHGGGATQRGVSASPVDLSAFESGGVAGVPALVKAHGILMVLAWLLLSNLGVTIARHFKPLFPGVEPGGVKLWFQLHRFTMITVLLATISGFIIIFVQVGEFADHIMSHAVIGIIVMGLALLNPIMAVFRPNPNAERRPIFNWMHYSVGSIARILSIANLFLGVEAYGSLTNWIAILGGFVGWVTLNEIVLEILSFHYLHTVLGMERNVARNEVPGSSLEVDEGKGEAVRGQTVKTVVLVIYALGLLGFFIAFLVAVLSD